MTSRLTIYLLALGAFLTGTVELVVAGILPQLATDLNISVALAGQLITAYSLAFAIGTPIVIAFTPRVKRKTLLLISLAVFIVGCFSSYIITDYVLLMIGRIVIGLSSGVFLVIALSSVAKLVEPNKIGSAIGTIALGFGGALALGVPIGIAITQLWGWQMIFIILGALSLLVMVALMYLLPFIEGDAPATFKQQFAVLGNPVILSGFILTLLMCTSNSLMLTYLTPFLQSILHMNATNVGWMMVALGIAGIVGSRFGGYGSDKWGAARMIAVSLTLAALTLLALPFVTVLLPISLLLIVVWMLSLFLTGPAVQTYFIQQAPQSANLVLGLNTSIVHLGTAVGAGAGGVLFNSTSTVLFNPWVASATMAFGLGAAFISFALRRRAYAPIAS